MFNRLSLRQKIILIIVAASTMVLVFAALLWGYYDRNNLRNEMVVDLKLTTTELSYGMRKYVQEHDRYKMIQTLSSLKDNPGILTAWVVSPKGEIIAGYINVTDYTKNNPELTKPATIKEQIEQLFKIKKSYLYFDKSLGLVEPIVYGDKVVGYLFVFEATLKLEYRTIYHIKIVSVIALISILLSIFLAYRMHQTISRPVMALASVMDKVSRNKDYSVRIKVATQKDEIAELMKVFNEMIGEIERHHFLQKKNAAAIKKLAYFDALTEMANRRLFHEYLDLVIQHSKLTKQSFSLIFIDLDKFKFVNDTMGHDKGDIYLTEIAKRLKASLYGNPEDGNSSDPDRMADNPERPLVSRLGGDEFTIIYPNATKESITKLADIIVNNCKQEIMLGDKSFNPSLSIGIALYPADGIDEEKLLKSADLAMYQSKQKRAMVYTFFEDIKGLKKNPAEILESEIRSAIDEGSFYLEFQPFIDMHSNNIIGAEALFRWKHNTRGILYPKDFIYQCEKMDIMNELYEITLKEVCKNINTLKSLGINDFMMSINISPSQFKTNLFQKKLEQYISSENVNPKQIMLEVVESVCIEHLDVAHDMLVDIRKLGTHIAIDDFGTGYSSLHYLAMLPYDFLKIEREFIRNMLTNSRFRNVVRAIIEISSYSGLTVIAEGVEQAEQKQFLLSNGCHFCQGYYYEKAIPFEQIITKLQEMQNRAKT